MASTEHGSHHRKPAGGGGYERRDTNWRLVLKMLGALTVATVVVVYFMWVLLVFLERHTPGKEPSRGVIPVVTPLPPEPRLQLSTRKDMEEFRAQEDAVLNSYGWVDRSTSRVRVPLARAVELTLQEGIPHRDPRQVSARDQMTSFAADAASGRFVERKRY